MLNGFINYYKPKGITSNKALCILKHKLIENNIDTKIGHFGTLDPIAEGVLPIALGRATRLFDYSLDKIKRYTAEFRFGINTDTLDSDGNITYCDENVNITEEQIRSVLKEFVGTIKQVPPNYSAKSVGGVKAYKLARSGEEFCLEAKEVTVFSFELTEKVSLNLFRFDITCSAGTYIRSLIRDLAKKLNTCGIMTALIRTQSGFFDINDAVNIESFRIEDIKPIDIALTDYAVYDVKEYLEKPLFNGVRLRVDDLPDKKYFVVKFAGKLVGIGEKDENNEMYVRTWLI